MIVTSKVSISKDAEEGQGVAVHPIVGVWGVQAFQQVSDVTHMNPGLSYGVRLCRRKGQNAGVSLPVSKSLFQNKLLKVLSYLNRGYDLIWIYWKHPCFDTEWKRHAWSRWRDERWPSTTLSREPSCRPSMDLSSAKLSSTFPSSCREKQVRWQVSSRSINTWWISCTISCGDTWQTKEIRSYVC